jgi:hypothetical protein
MVIYLGSQLLRASSDLTRPVFPPPGAEGNSNGLFFPLRERGLFGLAPGGVYPAAPIAQDTGELLPHLFTLIPTFVRTVYFLWHFPYPRPLDRGQSALRTTLPCGARTFLPSCSQKERPSVPPRLPSFSYQSVEKRPLCQPSAVLPRFPVKVPSAEMTRRLSDSRDFTFCFDLPPRRECGYSWDTERWHCFFGLR